MNVPRDEGASLRACPVRSTAVRVLHAGSPYTQAAFNDVMNEEKERNATTEEGEAEFDKISKVRRCRTRSFIYVL